MYLNLKILAGTSLPIFRYLFEQVRARGRLKSKQYLQQLHTQPQKVEKGNASLFNRLLFVLYITSPPYNFIIFF